MAVGIVTFALLTVVGLFGGMIARAGDNIERRSMMEAVDALRGHLLVSGFNQSYNWARSTNQMVFVNFRANDSGQPSPSGSRTLGRWLQTNDTAIPQYDEARVGRWIKARMQVSHSNPSGTNLPPSPNDYEAAVLAVLVQMEPVARPELPLPATPRLETTIGVTR